MVNKKVFLDLKITRELRDPHEHILYGWVDREVLGIPSIIGEEDLDSYRECLELTPGGVNDSDYVLQAASEDECICFLNHDDQPHFMWMYEALFSKFGVRLPFTNF